MYNQWRMVTLQGHSGSIDVVLDNMKPFTESCAILLLSTRGSVFSVTCLLMAESVGAWSKFVAGSIGADGSARFSRPLRGFDMGRFSFELVSGLLW